MSLFWKDRTGPEPSGREPGDTVPHSPPPSRCSTVPVSAPLLDLIWWVFPFLGSRDPLEPAKIISEGPSLPASSPSSLLSIFLPQRFSHLCTPFSSLSHLSSKKDVTFIWHYKVYEVLYMSLLFIQASSRPLSFPACLPPCHFFPATLIHPKCFS